MKKLALDKYYTPPDLALQCINRTFELIGRENIGRIIEPSAGNGSFSNQIEGCVAFDIEPETTDIIKLDFLALESIDFLYEPHTLIIGNPPYGRCLNTAQKFFKQATKFCDYISFILPISQLNIVRSMYEFDLIHSEDLGKRFYTDRWLHCCHNVYVRPASGKLNKKPKSRLADVTIVRQDSKRYSTVEYDLRMCYWGDATAGKFLENGESYSGEYKIKIHNDKLRDEVVSYLRHFDWAGYLNCIAMRKIQQFHIVDVLCRRFPDLK